MSVGLSRRSMLALLASAMLLTAPLASWQYSPMNSLLVVFLTVLAGLRLRSARLSPARLRVACGVGGRAIATLVCLVVILGMLHGDETLSAVVTFLGAALFVIPGIALGVWPRRYWEVPLAISAAAAAVVGIGHYFGVIPLLPFEYAGPASRSVDMILLGRGYTGLIQARGDYGIWLVGGLMVAARWWLLESHRTRRWIALALTPLLLLAGITSQSRSTWLALGVFVAGTALVAATGRVGNVKTRLAAILFGGSSGLALLLAGIAGGTVQALVGDLIALHPVTVGNRIRGNALALAQILENPLLGGGISSAMVDVGTLGTRNVHNAVLFISAAFGLGAGILLALAWFAPLKRAVILFVRCGTAVDRLRHGLWIMAIVAVLSLMMFFAGFGSKYFWLFMGIAYGELGLPRAGESAPRRRRSSPGRFVAPSRPVTVGAGHER